MLLYVKRNVIFVLVSQRFKREAVCAQGETKIFNTPLQMSIPYGIVLFVFIFCKKL